METFNRKLIDCKRNTFSCAIRRFHKHTRLSIFKQNPKFRTAKNVKTRQINNIAILHVKTKKNQQQMLPPVKIELENFGVLVNLAFACWGIFKLSFVNAPFGSLTSVRFNRE